MDEITGLSPRERALRDYDENFIKYWDKAFSELKAARADENKMWLVGSSSYLFSVGGVKFAVDLQIRRMTDIASISDRLCDDIGALSFILITHQHDDHFCIPLIKHVCHLPIKWYLPSKMPEEFFAAAGISEDFRVSVGAGESFTVGGLRITAFDSQHVRKNSTVNMPENGYYIETKDGSFVIPADVRDYGYRDYPSFDGVDLCISHLWAGDNAIDEDAYLPMIDEFVDFSLSLGAKRYFICHLYEIGRKDKYMWHDAHAALAIERFLKRSPGVTVEIPRLGCSYKLF